MSGAATAHHIQSRHHPQRIGHGLLLPLLDLFGRDHRDRAAHLLDWQLIAGGQEFDNLDAAGQKIFQDYYGKPQGTNPAIADAFAVVPRGEGPVEVDMLVGDDGVARAITRARFLDGVVNGGGDR